MQIKFFKKLSIKDMVTAAIVAGMCIIVSLITRNLFTFGFLRISIDWMFMFIILFITGWGWGVIIGFLLDAINLLISGGIGMWRWYFALSPVIAITLLVLFHKILHNSSKWLTIRILYFLMVSTLTIMNIVHYTGVRNIPNMELKNVIVLISFLFIMIIQLFLKKDYGLVLSLIFVFIYASMFWGTFCMLKFQGLKLTSGNFFKFFTPRLIKMVPEVVITYVCINAFFMIKNKK